MNHYVPLSLTNRKSAVHMYDLYSPRTDSLLEYSLGGIVVSVQATGPKGCGFKTSPRRWIFKGDINPQHTFLSDGK
jgi:hypothetical protein